MSLRLADGIEAELPTVDPFEQFEILGGGSYLLDLGGVFPRESSVDMTVSLGMALETHNLE